MWALEGKGILWKSAGSKVTVPEWIVRTGVLPLPERAAPRASWRRPWAQAHKRQRPRLTGNNNDSNRLVHGGRSA